MKKTAGFVVKLLLLALLLMAAVVVATPGVPQDPPDPSQQQRPRKVLPDKPEKDEPQDIVRFDTDLVSVDVTAMDSLGRPIRNLRPEDFKVYSDGVQQEISFFQIEKRQGELRPLAIVFALDVSGSMTSDEIVRLLTKKKKKKNKHAE